jgi:hypothetical protein
LSVDIEGALFFLRLHREKKKEEIFFLHPFFLSLLLHSFSSPTFSSMEFLGTRALEPPAPPLELPPYIYLHES